MSRKHPQYSPRQSGHLLTYKEWRGRYPDVDEDFARIRYEIYCLGWKND